jgi:hypothetical protein
MTHLAAILWYSIWGLTIVAGYYASEYAIKVFDKKWKEITEAEEQENKLK